MITKIKTAGTAQQVREIEAKYREPETGLCYGLMQKAGESLYRFIEEKIQMSGGNCSVLIVCGAGNNGGDGYEAAARLLENGRNVVCAAYRLPKSGTEAELAYRKYGSVGGRVFSSLAELTLDNYGIIVDGLLGIGLVSEVRSEMSEWISLINSSNAYRIAVDIPSGLNSENGLPEGCAVVCDATLTFVMPKIGLMIGEARDYVGELLYDDLDLKCVDSSGCIEVLSYEEIADKLPKRKKCGNKITSGRLGLIGGQRTMPGAIRMAAKAALRAGAGLVRVASCGENLPVIASDTPELMLFNLDRSDIQELENFKTWSDAMVIGPGLGRGGWSERIWQSFRNVSRPVVIDADALYFYAMDPDIKKDSVITPHEGEAARLLGTDSMQIRRNRIECIRKLQRLTGGVVVLKGAGTMICNGEKTVLIDNGCEGMSVGGMGDLLSGIIGALLAFGLSPTDAAIIGVAVHGKSGEQEAVRGMIGMLPSDLLEHIRLLMNGVIS